jgi:hypothetical protein
MYKESFNKAVYVLGDAKFKVISRVKQGVHSDLGWRSETGSYMTGSRLNQ